jgi:nucleoid-associated protein YgaU
MVLVAATCAAFAVIGFGSVFVAKTSNWSNDFDHMAHRIDAAPSSPQASSQPAQDAKTAAATLGYSASVADASAAPLPSLTTTTKPAAAPRHASVQIRPGDTFHDLAAKYLGSEDRTWELIHANPQIKDPNNLYVGQTIYLPSHQPTKLAGEVQ